MNYILLCASEDLGIFFTFFYCTEKKHQVDICCTKDFLDRDIGELSIPLIFKVTFNVF